MSKSYQVTSSFKFKQKGAEPPKMFGKGEIILLSPTPCKSERSYKREGSDSYSRTIEFEGICSVGSKLSVMVGFDKNGVPYISGAVQPSDFNLGRQIALDIVEAINSREDATA